MRLLRGESLLDPELPPNAGLFDPITVQAPAGTIVNPNPPAACGAGGAGRTRGGLGIARQIRALAPGTVLSARSDSHTIGVAAGVLGGGDGRRARLIRNPGRPDEEVLFSKVARLELQPGDSLRIETPGGGGFGDPAERPAAAVLRDTRDGYVSIDHARACYGKDRVNEPLAKS